MALRFLLDTNVVSELTKAVPNPALASALQMHEAACAIGAPTLEELFFGCARLPSGTRRVWFRTWIEGLVARTSVLPYDSKAAAWLGEERARLAGISRPAPRTDGEIAAIAVTSGLTLVTRNTRDFAGFAGLALQDWYEKETAA
ncbi:MAG: hypothetical protein AD742_08090 [Methylibium sp. NZG]|nr:MAG: hypothetical protein AD742_08090 [Methylibium sp. NZG]